MSQHSDNSKPGATKPLTQSRRLKKWAVSYTSTAECDYGYEHEIGNVLVGLDTEDIAKQKAKKLKGKIKHEWYTPPLTDEEIKLLNSVGVPVERNNYGLGFKGMAMAIGDSPASLQSVVDLYVLTRKTYHGN